MKRFLSLLLCVAMLCSLAVVTVSAAQDATIDSQQSVFPADTTVKDLYLSGDCPETVILINVKVEGVLYVNADHPVTVRFQGDSHCAAAELNSKATLIGGTYGRINVNNAYSTFSDATAETLTLEYAGGLMAVDGNVKKLFVYEDNIFVGGSGRAEAVTVNGEGCSVNLRYGSLENNSEEEDEETDAIVANFVVTPTISPSNSVVDATVTFSHVPQEYVGDYRIYWYIGETLSYYDWTITLEDGATASMQCSAHFYDENVDVLPVWVKLIRKSTDEELRFVSKVNVVGYSLEEYEEMDVRHPYAVHLLRNQNVIIIYGMDENGEYTKVVNVFLCSTGYWNDTELGDFEIGLQMRWGSLMADLKGQYSSQFNYNQLFHSVPYWSTDLNNIEWEEYEKLGTAASSGCVRLATIDAKWIYDHCHTGTPVKVYDVDELPVQKPVPCIIREDYIFRGWDPTDPDPYNPTSASESCPKLSALRVGFRHPVYGTYMN